MNRSRLLLVFSAIAILAMVLTSCAQPTEEPGEEATPVIVEEKVTLTVWDFGGAEFAWMDATAIPAFQEKFPNIEINHVGVPEDDLGIKLETAIAAGEVPDLVTFPPARAIKAGHILFLDDYLARDDLSWDDYCPLFESWNTVDGRVHSLPVDSNIWVLPYNKDLFAEAGLPELGPDDVIDFDDWLEYARAINKPADALEERVWGSAFLWPQWNSMFHNQSDPFSMGDDGRSCAGTADTDDWIHVWENLLIAYDEDLTPETAGALLADVEEDMFVQGKLGMTYGALGDALYAKENGINVGLVGQPVVNPGWQGNVGGWNTLYSIMAATEHPDEAWEFLKWLSLEGPLVIPIGTDQLAAGGGGGLPGLPCYLPLYEEEKFITMIAEEPLVADAVVMMERIEPAPFTVDIWTSTDPFYEAFGRMSEDRVDVAVAIHEAAQECQEITDELWEEYDALGE